MRRGRAAQEAPVIRLGEKGLVLIEYVGGLQSIRLKGPATCQRYLFGDTRRVGYVDVRDAGMIVRGGYFRKAE